MKEAVWSTLAAMQLVGPWIAVAQASGDASTQTQRSGIRVILSPAGAVSGGAQWQVDGGAWQSSGAVLTGMAPGAHDLSFRSTGGWGDPTNESATLLPGRTNLVIGSYRPVVVSGGSAGSVPATASAPTRPPPPGNLRVTATTSSRPPAPAAKSTKFAEEQSADFIARYYSDEASYALKPLKMEGQYKTICDRALLLKLAGEQPRHELAVVVLVHYAIAGTEDAVKLAWVKDLTGLGYRRIVFLRGGSSMQVSGLPILDFPDASALSARK
jgi:hypothetical protein